MGGHRAISLRRDCNPVPSTMAAITGSALMPSPTSQFLRISKAQGDAHHQEKPREGKAESKQIFSSLHPDFESTCCLCNISDRCAILVTIASNKAIRRFHGKSDNLVKSSFSSLSPVLTLHKDFRSCACSDIYLSCLLHRYVLKKRIPLFLKDLPFRETSTCRPFGNQGEI